MDALTEEGNVHHIFPKAYLKKHGLAQDQYNKIANYVYLSQPRNLQISDQAPKDYLNDAAITQHASSENFAANAIPENLQTMTYLDYPEFLRERRELMADQIRQFYYTFSLEA